MGYFFGTTFVSGGGGGGGSPVPAGVEEGDVLYWNGTAWTLLAPGTDGDVLQTNGPGAPPSWVVPSGGGGSANITPDTHPSPELPWNDEFEFGSTLDTTGARFAGANPWTEQNFHASVLTVGSGALQVAGSGSSSANDDQTWIQPLAGVGATWAFTAKRYFTDAQNFSGLFLGFGASGLGYYFGYLSGTTFVIVQTDYAGTGATQVATATGIVSDVYFTIAFDGTLLHFLLSNDGIQFETAYSVAPAIFLGGPPDSVGMFIGAVNVAGGLNVSTSWDWFRKTA